MNAIGKTFAIWTSSLPWHALRPSSGLAQQQYSHPQGHSGGEEHMPDHLSLTAATLRGPPVVTEPRGLSSAVLAKVLSLPTWGRILPKETCSAHISDWAGQVIQIAKIRNISLLYLNPSNLNVFSWETNELTSVRPWCCVTARLSSPTAGMDRTGFNLIIHLSVHEGQLQVWGPANDKPSLIYQPISSIGIYTGMKLKVQIRPVTKPFQQLHLIRYCMLFTEKIDHTTSTCKCTECEDKSCNLITC